MKELISPLAFGIFVASLVIQCHYEGYARFALVVAAGVALTISTLLSPDRGGKRNQ